MYRIVEYGVLFISVVLVQVMLFNNIALNFYLNPFIYLAFLILLPVDLKNINMLLLALLLGATVDFLSGTPAISTISTVFAGFCRPAVLKIFLGNDEIEEGGTLSVKKVGMGKFLNSSVIIILLHNLVFFLLETASAAELPFTAARIAVSTLFTLAVVYFCQVIFTARRAQ